MSIFVTMVTYLLAVINYMVRLPMCTNQACEAKGSTAEHQSNKAEKHDYRAALLILASCLATHGLCKGGTTEH